MPVQRLNPATIHRPGGYTHVVKDGNTVYVAGQTPRDKDGNTVGVGDVTAQAELVYQNLREALASVGGSLSDIVKTTTFMTHREDIPAFRAVRDKYLKEDELPASTLLLCSGLADPDFRIEIEAIAVLP